MIITVTHWALLVIGLGAATYFLLTAWPAYPMRLAVVVTHGFPAAVALFYLRAMLLLAMRGGHPRNNGVVDTITSLVLLLVVAAILVGTVVVWKRFQISFHAEERRLETLRREDQP